MKNAQIAVVGRGISGSLLLYYLLPYLQRTDSTLLWFGPRSHSNRPFFFYEDSTSPSMAVASHVWKKIRVDAPHFSRHQMLSGGSWYLMYEQDLYDFVERRRKNSQVKIIQKSVKKIRSYQDLVEIQTEQESYQVEQVFDSSSLPLVGENQEYQTVYSGNSYSITTDQSIFDPTTLVLADQRSLPRGWFACVAARTVHQAHVQLCWPHRKKVSQQEALQALEQYAHQVLQLENYEIEIDFEHQTDRLFQLVPTLQPLHRVIPIGVKAGWISSASGFALRRIDRECQRVVREFVYPKTAPKKLNAWQQGHYLLLKYPLFEQLGSMYTTLSIQSMRFIPLEYLSKHL